MRHPHLILIPVMAAGLSACDHHGQTPTSPTSLPEAEALLATAPSLSFDAALDDMDLTASERSRLGTLADGLHTAMMDVHDAMNRFHDADGEQAGPRAHEVIQAQMTDLQARHEVFMESMTDEQRAAFTRRVHDQMAEHHGADGMDADEARDLHDVMREHHDDGDPGRHHPDGHPTH